MAEFEQATTRIDGSDLNSETCPSNKVYDEIIDKIYERIYDPSELPEKEVVKTQYNCQIKTDEDALRYADKVLAATKDPRDDLFTKEEIDSHQNNVVGKGIGALIQRPLETSIGASNLGPDAYLVEHVAKDSSADKSGLKRGDKILQINDQPASQLKYSDLVKSLTNSLNQDVNLTVERDGQKLELNIPIVETDQSPIYDKLVVDPVTGDELAYIKVNTFYNSEVAQKLEEAIKRYPDVKGFIIDMRDNGGGWAQQALNSASLFIDEGVIFRQRKRAVSDPKDPKYIDIEFGVTENTIYKKIVPLQGDDIYIDGGRYPDLVEKPTYVLANRSTISSAELFTSALQENGDAKVIGTRTLGKGQGQTMYPKLPLGSVLRISDFRSFTPNGNWLGNYSNRIGIKPDLEVKNKPGALRLSEDDAQFNAALMAYRTKF